MLKRDFHIHSIHSGHAYGTVYDIINEAKKKNMDMIAITDHGPSMPGVSGHAHFLMGDRKPLIEGLQLLWGCEANVIDENGNIDLPEELQKRLDVLMLGFHMTCGYEDQGSEKNTAALMKALENPRVKVLTHPAHQQYEVDFEEVCRAAVRNDVLLEINLAYLKMLGERDTQRFKRIVQISRDNGQKIIVNSDAHFLHEIADDSVLETYKERIGLRDDMIINNYFEELAEFLGIDR